MSVNFQVFLEHAHLAFLTTQQFLFYISLSFKGEEPKVALQGNEIDASTDDAEDRADLISGSELATGLQVIAMPQRLTNKFCKKIRCNKPYSF